MSIEKTIQVLPIARLQLDTSNPRLASIHGTTQTQNQLLSNIIENHGINDLLVSMSKNGFFEAEPIVGVGREDEPIVIAEGNRRLAAALVLTRDERAAEYFALTDRYAASTDPEVIESLKSLPVSVFPEKNNQLISYIGARHIRGNRPWDSYAKARWLFELLATSDGKLTVEEACKLIGDQTSGTVKRILEGYILMEQLVSSNMYNPKDSQMKGKGSNPDYPFSWIYTAIGYENIRNFLDISTLSSRDSISATSKVLNTKESLENAAKLITFIYGKKSEGKRPVINESRELRHLNAVIKNRLSVRALEDGELATEVYESQRPPDKRIFDLFYGVRKDLNTINEIIAGEVNFEKSDKEEILSVGEKSQAILKTIINSIQSK